MNQLRAVLPYLGAVALLGWLALCAILPFVWIGLGAILSMLGGVFVFLVALVVVGRVEIKGIPR